MTLPSINLDDRSFDDLVAEAQRWIVQSCPEWTDLSPGDPGMTLVEVFAHLTEVMLYRLNRVPEKNFIAFLGLIGVKLHPPCAAETSLRFRIRRPAAKPIVIPRGTRITTARVGAGNEPLVFATAEVATIEPNTTEVSVSAYHCEMVEAELVGKGTGRPGLAVQVRQPPIVARTRSRDNLDLVVGVEAEIGADPDVRALNYEGKAYRIWREVEDFTHLGEDRYVYVADRLAGTITFAPALRMETDGQLADNPKALAEIPAVEKEVRVWYWRGGGADGNVDGETLTVMKDAVQGIAEVTNPKDATGGRAAETLENALARGPQEIHSLRRAVTARDFELMAIRSTGAVDRAHAFTKAGLWHHALPGTVEVIMVPHLPDTAYGDGPVTQGMLEKHQDDAALERVKQALDVRRPLGTKCLVSWAHYKPVQVVARIVVYREEDPIALKTRILKRLYAFLNPLPRLPDAAGWSFGEGLNAWHVYKIIGAEPGVKNIEPLRFRVEDVPHEHVSYLSADAYQANTWYASAADTVYRSMNDAVGWEPVIRFEDETLIRIKAFPLEAGTSPQVSGLVAALTRLESGAARLYLSRDCGESWEFLQQTRFGVADFAWLLRDRRPALLLASEKGLFEIAARKNADPRQLVVDAANKDLGFYAVTVSTDEVRGQPAIAVAGRGEEGVFFAADGVTFRSIGLRGELVRILAVQHRGPHRYLWAGIAAPGTNPGKGCLRLRITTEGVAPGGWSAYAEGWHDAKAGSCLSLAFQDSLILAGTRNRGVLRLDTNASSASWSVPNVDCGLPLRELGRLQPIPIVASDPNGKILLAGGRQGIYRSTDNGVSYMHCSGNEFSEGVTLPPTWLLCSQEHEITVVNEDED
jgi:hypothetical protein